MIKLIMTLTAALVSMVVFSQASENRTVGSFNKLKASTQVQVFYTVSDRIKVEVSCEDQQKLAYVKTEVKGSTLEIYIDSNNRKSKKDKENYMHFKNVQVLVSGPNLQSIKASASASVHIKNQMQAQQLSLEVGSSADIIGNFKGDSLTIQASSSGDVKAQVDFKNLSVDASSSADVQLEGNAQTLIVEASSSADCLLRQLKAQNAEVLASSSADVTVQATASLHIKASSSADVVYYGTPAKTSFDKNSSGSITHK